MLARAHPLLVNDGAERATDIQDLGQAPHPPLSAGLFARNRGYRLSTSLQQDPGTAQTRHGRDGTVRIPPGDIRPDVEAERDYTLKRNSTTSPSAMT